ncbi:MAG: cell division protein CrgA [Bifidobacteriaceae bacterium]|jgi:hypothetical protein|nr:cell division protein CrgA [Bifidobacteriaceae bacterium]
MPESRTRAKKKVTYTAPPAKKVAQPSSKAWAVIMVTLMVAGLVYVVWSYLATNGPIPGLGNWNLMIGLAAILAGFGMTMRWR